MLLERNGKFTMWKSKSSRLSYSLVESYLRLICEYELHSLPNKKVSGAKDHGKNYIKVRPPLVSHLLRNRLSLQAEKSCKISCKEGMLHAVIYLQLVS